MQIAPLAVSDVKLIVPKRYNDARGFFSEVYNLRELARMGIEDVFVQDNVSMSEKAGTVRGLHFQKRPHAQVKLVRVGRGRIIDVAVDLRRSSPTFGRHVAAHLSAQDGNQLYIPAGFAHGFCTLEPDTEVVYKVTDFYEPRLDAGVHWSDPDLAIDWPVKIEDAVVSEKDARLPLMRDIDAVF